MKTNIHLHEDQYTFTWRPIYILHEDQYTFYMKTNIHLHEDQYTFYMKTNIHLLSYLAQFFLDWEMFRTKAVEKIKTHILY